MNNPIIIVLFSVLFLAALSCQTTQATGRDAELSSSNTKKDSIEKIEAKSPLGRPLETGMRMDMTNTVEQMDERIGVPAMGFKMKSPEGPEDGLNVESTTSCTVSTDGTRECERKAVERVSF